MHDNDFLPRFAEKKLFIEPYQRVAAQKINDEKFRDSIKRNIEANCLDHRFSVSFQCSKVSHMFDNR